MGRAPAASALGGEDWFFTWAINAPLETITRFRVGSATVGEPLASWGNAVLERELTAVKPAHTLLQFHYA